MIIGGILLFYLSGILVVIGLLIAKVTERQRERKTEKEKCGYDRGKLSERKGCRIWNRYKSSQSYKQKWNRGPADDVEGGSGGLAPGCIENFAGR